MHDHARTIVEGLEARGDPEKARWLENYVKHAVRSFGVGIPAIRELVQELHGRTGWAAGSVQEQTPVLDDLMAHSHTEPKLAAILSVQLFWTPDRSGAILDTTSAWFDRGWIADWNVCDWLCVRLLTPVLDHDPERAVATFREWNGSPQQWKARASLVPFAQSHALADHTKAILEMAEVLIRREERFCKTAVGWVLREYSKVDPGAVSTFLERWTADTTPEVVRNATKYIRKT